MKQQGTLSPAQLRLLVWAGLMAPAAEDLPGLLLERAGHDAWLSVLLGSLLALVLGRLLFPSPLARLGEHFPGKVLLLIYMVWMELLLALRLGLCARRLLSAGSRDGSGPFFLLVAVLLLLRLNSGTLPAFARAGQVFLAALAVTAATVLALSLPTASLERLRPVGLPPLSPALVAAGVLSWGLLPAALLPVEGEARRGRLAGELTACLVLVGAQVVILANLGAGLSEKVGPALFALAKGAGLEGAFQRLESVVSALWLFADLTMGGLLVFAQRRVVGLTLGEKWEQRGSTALILGAALLALAGLSIGTIENIWIPVGNLVLVLSMVILTGVEQYRERA